VGTCLFAKTLHSNGYFIFAYFMVGVQQRVYMLHYVKVPSIWSDEGYQWNISVNVAGLRAGFQTLSFQYRIQSSNHSNNWPKTKLEDWQADRRTDASLICFFSFNISSVFTKESYRPNVNSHVSKSRWKILVFSWMEFNFVMTEFCQKEKQFHICISVGWWGRQNRKSLI
jgi:hypothetical protein